MSGKVSAQTCPTAFPWQVKKRLQKGQKVVFVDVRKAHMYEKAHLSDAVSMPFDQVAPKDFERALPDKQQPIVVYCYIGVLSKDYTKMLLSKGYEDVVSLSGGFPLCKLWL